MGQGTGSSNNAVVPQVSINNEGVPQGSSNNEVVPSLNLLLILKEESGVDLFSLSQNALRTRLLTGLILRDKENTETKLYWMDDKSNSHCFMLLPKSLRINAGRGQVPRYVDDNGKWCTGLDATLPLVKYERVSEVNVGGKFCTMGLSGGSEYEVVLFLQLIPTGGRRSIYSAASAKLSLPDGNQTQKPWARVRGISPGERYPYPVGTFRMNSANIGELSFDLQFGFWGNPDILIKGVAIKSPPSVK